jgi:hypothetical protein
MTNRGALTAAVKDAATQLGLQLTILEARAGGDFEAAFAWLAELHPGALLVSTDPLFTERRDELVGLAARYAVPASYAWRELVVAGGLVSYGPSIAGAYRQAGVYAGRILNGDSPQTFRWFNLRFLSWWSTSRPPRRSASRSRPPSSLAPTRSSNDPPYSPEEMTCWPGGVRGSATARTTTRA